MILALALVGLASGAWAQGVGLGGIQFRPSFIGGAVSAPILFPDGAVGAPSISFANDTDKGFYSSADNILAYTRASLIPFAISTTSMMLNSTYTFGWTSGVSALSGADTFLGREAAATVQMGVDAATATAQIFKGADSTGATIAGGNLTIRAGSGTSGIANGGQLILGGGLNSSTGEPGAVAFEDRGTKPTCAAGIRGSVWYDAGAGGVADTFEVCAKSAADAYAWRVLATIP
jgi:hypothetical protein